MLRPPLYVPAAHEAAALAAMRLSSDHACLHSPASYISPCRHLLIGSFARWSLYLYYLFSTLQWGNPNLQPLLGMAWDCGAGALQPLATWHADRLAACCLQPATAHCRVLRWPADACHLARMLCANEGLC